MSERWSDAELIRICLEGSSDELTDEVIAALQSRLKDSLLIRDAVRESPHSALLEKRLEFEPEGKPPGLGKAFAVLALLAVAGGIAFWFQNQGAQQPVPPNEEDVAESDPAEPDQPAESEPVKPDSERAPSDSDPETPEVAVVASEPDQPVEPVEEPPAETVEEPDTAAEVATVPAVDPESDEPWAQLLSPDNAPRSFDEVAWVLPGMEDTGEFPANEFRRWFERIPGRPFSVSDHKHGNKRFTYLDGVARLRAPWVENALLKFALYDPTSCELSFWNGNDGLRLRLYRVRTPHRWAVHRIQRRDAKSPAEVGELLTTDLGRWHRSFFGPLDVRWENEELILARGSVRLLSVPSPKPPQEVVLTGKLRLRLFTMLRADEMPELDEPLLAAEVGSRRQAPPPAELTWKTSEEPGVSFQRSPPEEEGAIELAVDGESKAMGWSSVSVPNPGLSEFVFRLDQADPGTGLFLGDQDGKPLYLLNLAWDPKNQRSGFVVRHASQPLVEFPFNRDNDPGPWIGPSQWLRLTFIGGVFRPWISPDGEHWGELCLPLSNLYPRISSVGVFAHHGGERKIRLSHISTYERPMLASVADAGLVEQVDLAKFQPIDVLDTGAWVHRVIRTRPDGVLLDDWRRACAVASLRALPSTNLQLFLINGLLADGLFRSETGDIQIDNTDDRAWKLLSEAAELINLAGHAQVTHLTHLWHEVTRLLARQMTDPDFRDNNPSPTLVSMETLLRSEFVSPIFPPFTAQQAAAMELTALVQAGDQDERVFELIDRLAFWNTNSHPNHSWWSPVDPIYSTVVWAELTAHRSLDGDTQAERFSLPFRWKTILKPIRQTLAQRVSKEAYNVMAEFQAAIDGSAFNDACQIIASSDTVDLIGLLPDGRDRRLLVSFPNAVALAMDRYPTLRANMNNEFGQVGRLRVRQAMESGDANQIEAATVQYYGTVAAAESEMWLGDRALAAGQFARARSYYSRALSGFRRNSLVNTPETKALDARIRLAASLMGETSAESESVEPVPVSFAGQELTADQFTALLTELAGRAPTESSSETLAGGQSRSPTGLRLSPRLPEIAGYKTEVRGRYEGDMGDRAGAGASLPDINWVSRQLAIEVDGTEAILTNRFQVSSIDLNAGTVKWRRDLGGDHGYAHQWPMLPMRALLTPNAIFGRWLTKKGIELMRVNRADGNLVWRNNPPQQVASDPMLVRGRLVAFAVEQQYAGPRVVTLLTLHPETGTVLNSVPVLQMLDAWPNATQVCQATTHDGRIYATVAGVALCCDGQGQTLWVRRRDAMDPALDVRLRYTRTWVPPLVAGDRLIVTQPECPTIECLDIETGRMLWQHVSLDLQRIVAHVDGRLLFQTRSGLECLDVESGQPQWLYPAADLHDGIAVLDPPPPSTAPADETPPPEAGILIARRTRLLEGRKNMFVPTLVWLDASTGHEVARQMLQPLVDTEPFVGPIIATPDKTWLFFAKNRKTPQREIRELIRDDALQTIATASHNHWAPWHPEFRLATYSDNRIARPHLTNQELPWAVHRALDAVCPGWILLAGNQPKESGLRPDHRSQKNALALQINPPSVPAEKLEQLGDSSVDAIRLVREVTLPSGNGAVLKFKIGHDAGQSLKLAVEADGTRLYSALVNDETAPNGWQAAHVPLDQFAGKTVRLVITIDPAERKQTWLYLAALQLQLP